jgi:hypothetical protein
MIRYKVLPDKKGLLLLSFVLLQQNSKLIYFTT